MADGQLIRVGDYFQGDVSKMTFVHDQDAGQLDASSFFRNVRVYEEASTSATIDVTVEAVADVPVLEVSDAVGNEDTPIALNVSAALADTDGSETLSVTIGGVPNGATLSAGVNNGDGTWTLNADELEGLTVTPAENSTDDFDLTVTATSSDVDEEGIVHFDENTLTSYGVDQDVSPEATVEDGGSTLHLGGNTWKDIGFNYTITEDTILELEFRADGEGEIHGIGFDTDESIDPSRTFKLYGTQDWGTELDEQYDGSGEWQTVRIRVGDYFQGDVSKMTFVHDQDAGQLDAASFFRNVHVYEEGAEEAASVDEVSTSATLHVTVQPVNEDISDLAFDGTPVAENAPAGTVVGTASATDPDSGETFTYELTGDADGRFEIDPDTGVVTVADGADLDFEDATSHTVTVKVTDSAGHERIESFDVAVSDVNEEIADLAFDGTSVAENAPAGTVVGTASALQTPTAVRPLPMN